MNYASQNAPQAPELCVTGESEKGEIQEFVCSLRAALCGIKIMVSVLVGDRDVVNNYSPRLKKKKKKINAASRSLSAVLADTFTSRDWQQKL